MQVQAGQAIEKLTHGLSNVHVTGVDAPITLDYGGAAGAGLHIRGNIAGHVSYAPGNAEKASADIQVGYDETNGFGGTISNVEIKASEYFHSTGGSGDWTTGELSIGTATFAVPGAVTGTVNTAEINLATTRSTCR